MDRIADLALELTLVQPHVALHVSDRRFGRLPAFELRGKLSSVADQQLRAACGYYSLVNPVGQHDRRRRHGEDPGRLERTGDRMLVVRIARHRAHLQYEPFAGLHVIEPSPRIHIAYEPSPSRCIRLREYVVHKACSSSRPAVREAVG